MNQIIWLFVGGILGWLASLIKKTDGQQEIILNDIMGIIGSTLGGWGTSPPVAVGAINQINFSMPALLVSFAGAVILLAIDNLLHRSTVR